MITLCNQLVFIIIVATTHFRHVDADEIGGGLDSGSGTRRGRLVSKGREQRPHVFLSVELESN